MQRHIRRTGCLMLILLLLINISAVFTVSADNGFHKVVKIGYYTGDSRFQDGFTDEERKSGYAYEYYQKVSLLTGWNYEYVYGSQEEILDKLLSGEVDITAGIHKTDELVQKALFSNRDMDLEGDPCYFAVNINRHDLYDELNHALDKLFASASDDFVLNLQQKYYSHDLQYALSESEKKWLSDKGNLNIGFVKSNMPLSDSDEDGNPMGVAKELFPMISSYINIPITPVCYDTVALMEEAMRKGEIDAGFPVYSDLWVTERKGLYQTDTILSDRVMIVFQGEYRDDIMDKVAVSRTGIGQRYYIANYSPNSEIIFYDGKKETLEAVQKGEANCMIGCSSILQRFFSENDVKQNYNVAYLDISEDFSMAVSHSENILVEILNKTIGQIDSTEITSSIIQHSNAERKYGLKELLRHYSMAVIVILCLFFAALLFVFIVFRSRTKRFNNQQARMLATLESALDSASAANEAKTSFLSNMSHDIRTPMNGIIGMTAIAAANIDDTARVKDCLAKITSSGKHLLALINEVLDMSKIESGEIHLNEDDIDLSELMDDLITMNKPLADSKHHEMVMHVVNVSHENVIGDKLRLQQVFTNLVSNAVKYTPEGGKISITLTEKPSKNPKRGCFEFSVEDNGIGMSEEYLPKLFDPFSRADNTSTNHTQGTGLGLTITRNIVQMMDGEIDVKSKVGKGSKFTVTLYLKLRETAEARYEDFVDLNILMVDDDKLICESTELILSELGMNCEWVLSGREAVKLVEQRHEENNDYFAVLIDWKMPDMDGVETMREIRKRVGEDMPIIIISAYDWSDIEVEATLAGVNCFIEKPLFKSRLVNLFERLLKHEISGEDSELKKLTEQTDFSGKRALLAEDNAINAEIATEILQMTGLEVDWAHDGREAVEKMQSSEHGYYDCIFMDIQMPVLNGIEAAKEIRKLPNEDAASIPIFAMTANAFADDVKAVLDAGMNEHIAKPIDFDILMNILNKYLNQ